MADNKEFYKHVLELRKGSRAQPIPSKKKYKRRAKHKRSNHE
jgi:hypothetical protein